MTNSPPSDPVSGLALTRVLVVDDVDLNRDMIKAHLGCATQHIDEAGDGFAALELFRQRRYDAVLLDIEMPGLDGYDTMAGMRKWEQSQQMPQTPILAVTSSDFPEDRQRIMDAGASAYLVKPLKQKDLIKELELFHLFSQPKHPMANLFPKMFAYASILLDEMESFEDPATVAKKLHQLRGMMAVYGFVDFAERLKQVQVGMEQEGLPKKKIFDQLRKELHDLSAASA